MFRHALITVLLASHGLHAAAATPPSAAGKPAPQQPTTATAAEQVTTSVNPMTGQPVSYESRMRQLENARLETSLLEEQIKQQNLKNSLELGPMRVRVERQKMESDMGLKGLGNKGSLDDVFIAKPSTGGKGAKPGDGASKGLPDREIAPHVPPAPPAPKLIAIYSSGKQNIALMEHAGQTHSLKVGDKLEGQKIEEVTMDAVRIGKTTHKLTGVTPLIATSDRQPIPGNSQPPGALPAQGGAAFPSIPMQQPGAGKAQTGTVPAMFEPFANMLTSQAK